MQQSPVYPIQLSLLNFTEESRQKLQEYICPLCKGIYIDPVIDSCAHIFCKKCFVFYLFFKTIYYMIVVYGGGNLSH